MTVTNAFFDELLDAVFNATYVDTPVPQYLGFIDEDGFTAVAKTDTMGSHAGWKEWGAYSEANRPQFGYYDGADVNVVGTQNPYSLVAGVGMGAWAFTRPFASQAIEPVNPTVGGKIRGVFLTTSQTKGDTSGILLGAWDLTAFSGGDTEPVIADPGDLFGGFIRVEIKPDVEEPAS